MLGLGCASNVALLLRHAAVRTDLGFDRQILLAGCPVSEAKRFEMNKEQVVLVGARGAHTRYPSSGCPVLTLTVACVFSRLCGGFRRRTPHQHSCEDATLSEGKSSKRLFLNVVVFRSMDAMCGTVPQFGHRGVRCVYPRGGNRFLPIHCRAQELHRPSVK